VSFEIKVGDKFRIAKEEYTLLSPGIFDTTHIITVTKVGNCISYYPRICGELRLGVQYSGNFRKYINDGFLVPCDAQEPSLQPDKATALNTDNAVCNKCGGRTKGLFSEFSGPRYCPECEK
jgi:hypothetical protein